MEDKTVELVVRSFSIRHYEQPNWSLSVFY